MKSRLITLVLSIVATSLVLVAHPAIACCFFKFRGISCPPDSHAQITIVSTGPSNGNVSGDYAYVTTNRTAFGGYRVGTGSRTFTLPSRILDSYNVVPSSGVTVLAHGPGCS